MRWIIKIPAMLFFGGLFAAGLIPPESMWLMGIGLAGFAAALFLPPEGGMT